MSFETIIYGVIEGSTWNASQGGYRKLQQKNLETLATLPLEDNTPIVRGMFSAPEVHPHRGTYRKQPIHFGCSVGDLEFNEVPLWVDKFEQFLKKLYWFYARAHIVTEVSGTYFVEWKIGANLYHTDNPEPTTNWDRIVLQDNKPVIDLNAEIWSSE